MSKYRDILKRVDDLLSSKGSEFSPRQILQLHDDIRRELETPEQEPVVWESTTPCYVKYITQSRYEKFSEEIKKHYKPFSCSNCQDSSARIAQLEDQLRLQEISTQVTVQDLQGRLLTSEMAYKALQEQIKSYRAEFESEVEHQKAEAVKFISQRNRLEHIIANGIRVYARTPDGNTSTVLASNLKGRENATLLLDEVVSSKMKTTNGH